MLYEFVRAKGVMNQWHDARSIASRSGSLRKIMKSFDVTQRSRGGAWWSKSAMNCSSHAGDGKNSGPICLVRKNPSAHEADLIQGDKRGQGAKRLHGKHKSFHRSSVLILVTVLILESI